MHHPQCQGDDSDSAVRLHPKKDTACLSDILPKNLPSTTPTSILLFISSSICPFEPDSPLKSEWVWEK